MTKYTPKSYIIWIIIIIIYFGSFAFLSTYEFQDWKYGSFIESLIAVFLGAGAIAIITAVILLFQSQLETQKEKGQKVFNEKIGLYKEAIEAVESIFEDNKIETEELQKLEFIILKLQLISSDNTIEKFVNFYQKIIDSADVDLTEENNIAIAAELKRAFSEFIGKCRVELQLAENELDKSIFQQIQDIVEKSDKKKGQKSDYKNWYNYDKFLDKEKGVNNKTRELIKHIHDSIINDYNFSSEISVSYTKSMISFKLNNAPTGRKLFLKIKDFRGNKFALWPTKDSRDPAPEGAIIRSSSTESYGIEIKASSDYNDDVKKSVDKSVDYIMNL